MYHVSRIMYHVPAAYMFISQTRLQSWNAQIKPWNLQHLWSSHSFQITLCNFIWLSWFWDVVLGMENCPHHLGFLTRVKWIWNHSLLVQKCTKPKASCLLLHHHLVQQLTSATPLRQLAGGCSHQFTGLPSGAGSNLSFGGFCITHLCCSGHLPAERRIPLMWHWDRQINQESYISFFPFFNLFPLQNHEAGDLSSTMLWDTLLWSFWASVPFQTFIAAPNCAEVAYPTTINCCL